MRAFQTPSSFRGFLLKVSWFVIAFALEKAFI